MLRVTAFPRWIRILILSVVSAAWLVTGAFVAIVAVSVALARGPAAPMTDLHAAAVTARYSLGPALLLLGATWLALPGEWRTVVRATVIWIGATGLLLATRRVSGWPLFVVALVALGIAVDAIRRLAATGLRMRRPAVGGV